MNILGNDYTLRAKLIEIKEEGNLEIEMWLQKNKKKNSTIIKIHFPLTI